MTILIELSLSGVLRYDLNSEIKNLIFKEVDWMDNHSKMIALEKVYLENLL